MEEQYGEQSEEVFCQIENSAEAHGGKELGQQREDPVRRKLNQHTHHLHDHNFHILEPGDQALACLARTCHRETDQQGKNDHLQHITLGHRCNGVRGENIDQRFFDRWRFFWHEVHACYRIHTVTWTYENRNRKAKRYGNTGRDEIKP